MLTQNKSMKKKINQCNGGWYVESCEWPASKIYKKKITSWKDDRESVDLSVQYSIKNIFLEHELLWYLSMD